MFKSSMFNVLGEKALMSDCPTGLLSCSLIVLQACRQTDWSSVRQVFCLPVSLSALYLRTQSVTSLNSPSCTCHFDITSPYLLFSRATLNVTTLRPSASS